MRCPAGAFGFLRAQNCAPPGWSAYRFSCVAFGRQSIIFIFVEGIPLLRHNDVDIHGGVSAAGFPLDKRPRPWKGLVGQRRRQKMGV
jgi:hypothetical protein